jgi:aryl-alcohol dehydrogenase-like predicted oxidoreductase
VEYVHLGRTGLSVSRLCLGTVNFGPVVTEPDAHSIMDAALDAGVNFLDTANTYGGASGKGRTEQIIGNWFAKGGGRRQATVLATKVFETTGPGPNDGRLSALNIRRALDASLTRLQTDYIDLYQFHHVDRTTPWDEVWQAIEVATRQGKIVYAGSSNFAGWHIAQAQEAAVRRGLFGLVSEQSIYNLLRRDVELEVLPAVRAYGLGFLAWAPLHEGILGGRRGEEGYGKRRQIGRAAEAAAERGPQLAQFEDLAVALGYEPGELALAWLLSQPGVTAPIIGPRHLQQLASAVRAISLTIDSTGLARLDEIFPGHQPAPEDYAW